MPVRLQTTHKKYDSNKAYNIPTMNISLNTKLNKHKIATYFSSAYKTVAYQNNKFNIINFFYIFDQKIAGLCDQFE